MESFWLYASVALNVVQAILLFFKDTINDFLKRQLASRDEEGQRRKSLLRQLYGEIELLPNHYFLWLTGGLIYIYGKSPEERLQGKEWMDKSNQEMDRMLGFIRVNRLEFPSSIQELLDNLTKAVQAEDVLLKPDLPTLSKKTAAVGEATQKIRDAIRAKLG